MKNNIVKYAAFDTNTNPTSAGGVTRSLITSKTSKNIVMKKAATVDPNKLANASSIEFSFKTTCTIYRNRG